MELGGDKHIAESGGKNVNQQISIGDQMCEFSTELKL